MNEDIIEFSDWIENCTLEEFDKVMNQKSLYNIKSNEENEDIPF